MTANDLKFYKALTNNDTGANGGRKGYTEIVTLTAQNILPNISAAEALAGVTRWRKIFAANIAADQSIAYNYKSFLLRSTAGDDRIYITPGTHDDTQADLVTPKLYGCGTLNANATTGQSTIFVLTENGDVDFASGDLIYIGTKDKVTDAGLEELNEIDTIIYTGNVATITLVTPLLNDYAQTTTRVANYFEIAELTPSFANFTVNSAAGTYDEITYPLIMDNKGSVFDSFTITFTSATNFSCTGIEEGSLGTGNITTDFVPTNTNTSTPYFTLDKDGFGGTFQAGDTITFDTIPASKGIWVKQVVPNNSDPISNNTYCISALFE